MSDKRKVLLSIRNVDVKFNVRGRILSAIRNVSLDILDGETIAIVGESGSGKSVLTKTFAGMLDSNGFISNGNIIFDDEELARTEFTFDKLHYGIAKTLRKQIGNLCYLQAGAPELLEIYRLKKEYKQNFELTYEEQDSFEDRLKEVNDNIIDATNFINSLNRRNKNDLEEYNQKKAELQAYNAEKDAIIAERAKILSDRKTHALENKRQAMIDAIKEYKNKRKAAIEAAKNHPLDEKNKQLVELIINEMMLSVGRYPFFIQIKYINRLLGGLKKAFAEGADLFDPEERNKVFDPVVFRVEYRETLENGHLLGHAIIDCAKVKYTKDWQKIRGCKIATVFQDPMTSLNPIITIGKQIMTVILKHQKCSYDEAKQRALDIMDKVGIPEPAKRFNDYPFEYSGGMRQRIVIAIALSCQPKILICDEPTTALDVTIQAQIIRLIKNLQKDLGFTTVFITHDLGVVANVADRVAVLYGGQVIEIGTVEDIFYDPQHPYTWALLSSLPQLSERGTDLFSIPGTPPSLYNKIIGDSFAPRNKYAMAIDLVKEPPMFKVSETHWAKTWLLDPRAPKIEKPHNIENLHDKMAMAHGSEI